MKDEPRMTCPDGARNWLSVARGLRRREFFLITILFLAKAHVFVVTGIGIARIAGEEIVQMAVGPAHRDLENGVERA